MFKKYNWKQPIYKNDLKSVILCGIVYSLIAGILSGCLDYLMEMLNVPISFSLILISFILGDRIRKGYYDYHILYPTLAIVFMVFGLIVSSLTFGLFINQFDFKMFLSLIVYFSAIIEPFKNLFFFALYHDIYYLLYGILDLLIYGFAFWYCFKLAKGRN